MRACVRAANDLAEYFDIVDIDLYWREGIENWSFDLDVLNCCWGQKGVSNYQKNDKNTRIATDQWSYQSA